MLIFPEAPEEVTLQSGENIMLYNYHTLTWESACCCERIAQGNNNSDNINNDGIRTQFVINPPHFVWNAIGLVAQFSSHIEWSATNTIVETQSSMSMSWELYLKGYRDNALWFS
jgi:hypothetical protein